MKRVVALAATPALTDAELDLHCPEGLFVARRSSHAPEDLGMGWKFSPWTCVWIRVRIERHSSLPLVTTVGGYVVAGADIVAATLAGTFELAPAGSWFSALDQRRLPTGPGRGWWIRSIDRPVGGRGTSGASLETNRGRLQP